ncbi:hydroxymethylbilane synthase [Wandonia haliotis]|uniref:Hydroxymethylbilane synthase n=1 Tax=Wandonia haliotis TaxID=574963 RepID=A0ABN1ML89_9FLAO
MRKIIIGSRGSDLALWQAHHVKSQLENIGCEVEIKIIKTQGDIIQHLSFDKMEGKGFFTKEIEAALLEKSIDLAVHSHKDLETNPPEGLVIAAVSEREDPADLLLIRKEAVDANETFLLKQEAITGTSSARRKSQMMRFRPDIEIKDLRGNVPTRIQKLRDGNYDAILLAKAGVSRLNIDLSEFAVVDLNPREFIPAPAQGVLGLQIRETDTDLAEILRQLDTPEVRRRIAVERGVLNKLDGGCQLPLGVYCPDDHHVFVSFSTNWEEGAIWEEYEVDDLEGIVDIIVQDLQEEQD